MERASHRRIAALALLGALLAVPEPCRPEPGAKAARPVPTAGAKAQGRVVASVDGVPIHESALLAALPDDAFAEQLEDLKKNKLARLVDYVIRERFLKERGVTVSGDELAAAVDHFERLVTTVGLACCSGGYASLGQFMEIHAYTMAEVRTEAGLTAGMRLYEQRLLRGRTTPQALAASMRRQRAQIEADYVRGYAICFLPADGPKTSGAGRAGGEPAQRAGAALSRLRRGEPFESVAREMTEAEAAAVSGGVLGLVRADHLGAQVGQVFRTLAYGSYSDVVRTNGGACVVMRRKLTDEDVASVAVKLAEKAAKAQATQEYGAALRRAKVLYY